MALWISYCCSAPSIIAYKQARNRGIKRDTPVPCEACYHFELYYILCTWLGHVYKIYPKVNSDKKSCDVMVERFSTSTRYALELVASADLTSLNEHVNQARIYHKALAAFQTWIINFFTISPKNKSKVKDYLHWTDDVSFLHVCHDLEWSLLERRTKDSSKHRSESNKNGISSSVN